MKLAAGLALLILPACSIVLTIFAHIRGTMILPHKMEENEEVFTPYLAFVALNSLAVVVYYIIFLLDVEKEICASVEEVIEVEVEKKEDGTIVRKKTSLS